MRADMAKVIVERPRKKGCAWNKPKGYQRKLRRYGEDRRQYGAEVYAVATRRLACKELRQYPISIRWWR
jgi:hypothetical protein